MSEQLALKLFSLLLLAPIASALPRIESYQYTYGHMIEPKLFGSYRTKDEALFEQ